MTYFKKSNLPTSPIISTATLYNSMRAAYIGTNWISSTFPSANRAIFVPFTLRETVIVTKLFCVNGGTAGNNIDMGIYDFNGTKLVSSGSTAQSGITTIQSFDITDTTIGPGSFYLAITMNGTTGTLFFDANASIIICQTLGIFQMAAAFVLPATATYAAISTANKVPFIGLLVGPTTIV